MQSSVTVDGKVLFLNPFMSAFISNILDAIVRSLKAPSGKDVEFTLHAENLKLTIDGSEVSLNLGHAQQIVGNVLKGIATSLKGTEGAQEIRFNVQR
jgi:hypothetical protein